MSFLKLSQTLRHFVEHQAETLNPSSNPRPQTPDKRLWARKGVCATLRGGAGRGRTGRDGVEWGGKERDGVGWGGKRRD